MKATQKNDLARQLLECLAMWDVSNSDAGDIILLMSGIHSDEGLPNNPLEGTGLTPATLPGLPSGKVN